VLFEIFGFGAAQILGVRGKTVSESVQGFNTFNVKTEGCGGDYANGLYPHPYLGFVHDPNCELTNNIGLLGTNVPDPAEGLFVIGIFGGSVAAQFAGFWGTSEFEQILNACYLNKKGKRFVVLNFADGAWKQPQQVIALSLFAKYIDMAISIEGYNEAQLLHDDYRSFITPSSNYNAVNPLLYKGYLAKNTIASLLWYIKGNYVLNNSNALKVLMLALRNAVMKVYGDGSESLAVFKDPFLKHGDGLNDYLRFVRQFAAIATSEGVDYYFVLQPSPLYKKLSEDEQKVVKFTSYKTEYEAIDQMFRNNFATRYVSMKDLFQNETRQVFYDDIHMANMEAAEPVLTFGGSKPSYGHQKMAEKLANFLGEKGAITSTSCQGTALSAGPPMGP
jgi:hypothetical protein